MIRNLLVLPLIALTAGFASAQQIRASKPLVQTSSPVARAAAQDDRVYELRTYFASPGKLDELHNRFKNHMLGFHEKYGIANLGYWVPTDNPKRMIVSLVSYPSSAARESSWAKLCEDRDWIQARRESELKGRILDAVREEVLSADEAADVLTFAAKESRAFEIRRFTSESGTSETLKTQVREQITKEFGKTNAVVRFFTPTGEGNRTTTTLMAFIIRPMTDGEGVEEVTVRRPGNAKAGLAASRLVGEVVTVMKPTEYSPLK